MRNNKNVVASAFIGVFFTAMAVLSLEVLLTRIFSFSIWYHFAYLTINMALLGFGSSGAVLSAFPKIIEKGGSRLMVWCSVASCVSIVVMISFFAGNPLQPQTVFSEPLRFTLSLFVYYIGITVPFFCAGLTIALALARFSDRISTLYFWDLVGGAAGSLLSLIFINTLGGAGSVLACAFLLLVAACFFARAVSLKLTGLLAVCTLCFLLAIPFFKNSIEFIPCGSKALSKVYKHPETYETIHSEWNAINRVDVFRDTDNKSLTPWLAAIATSEAYEGDFPRVYDIQYDAHNGSNIFRFNGDLKTFDFLDHHILKIPYLLLDKPRVMIIGVGGGIDVFNALKNSASSITAVELQPITVGLLKNTFADWVGNIYETHDHIRLIASEGRNYIKRDTDTYDLIQITATDTFAALTTGAYVLMESYLYTEEAISTYYDRLTDDGILCIAAGDHLLEGDTITQPMTSRLMLEYLNVLRRKGVAEPERHIAILGRKEKYLNLFAACPILKKSPFTKEEVDALRSFADRMRFIVFYDPIERNRSNMLAKILTAEKHELDKLVEASNYDIRPCTDNKPFFYNFSKWRNIFDFGELKRYVGFTPVYGQVVLVVMLLQSILFSAVFIVLPLFLSKRTKLPVDISLVGFLLYFFCLGIGFMFIEISFIQKYVLFLGYPAYAFAVTIFSLLLFSGIGSYLTGRFTTTPGILIRRMLVLLVPVVLCYAWLLNSLFDALIGYAMPLKIVVTALTQLPLGLVLGMFFPLGIKVVRDIDTRVVPWAWGVNGMSSVISTVLAIILAMNFGFRFVSYCAIGIYIIGYLGFFLAQRRYGRCMIAGE